MATRTTYEIKDDDWVNLDKVNDKYTPVACLYLKAAPDQSNSGWWSSCFHSHSLTDGIQSPSARNM